jgi:hypothetical protein
LIEFNTGIDAAVRRLSWVVGEVYNMIVARLVGSAIQVDPSMSWVLFFGGLVLLVGILYYFAKHTR